MYLKKVCKNLPKSFFGIFKSTDTFIGTNIPDNVEIDWEQMQLDVVNAIYDVTND